MKQQIESKISDGIYKFEKIKCCVCDSIKFRKLSNKDRYGLYMPVVICVQCGLIQTNPRMTQESYNEFYNNEYRKLYLGVEKPTKLFFSRQLQIGQLIYSYLLKKGNLRKTKRDLFVFEVGCGAGGILYYFKKKGFKIQGIDLGEDYIEYGIKNHDLDLSISTLKNFSFTESPDIIIYSHVFEHILDLKKELSIIHNILSDNGILYTMLPGVKNLFNSYNLNFLRYLQNAHTYHFTLTTLNNLLGTNGFKMIVGDETIKSVFKKDKIVNSRKPIINDYTIVSTILNRLAYQRILYYLIYFSKNIFDNLRYKRYNLLPNIKREIKGFFKN